MKAKPPAEQSFFIDGDCKDPAYRNVRDNPDRPEVRAFVDSLWVRYRDLADPTCRTHARDDFLARFWEMYLAVTLRERGFQLSRFGTQGPEFYFMQSNRKVWVEAVAPRAGDGEDQVPVPDYCYGMVTVTEVPTEKIPLRFTNALAKKRIKYSEALRKKIIEPDDLYLLAINSQGIPHALCSNTIPYFVQAFLPFGNLGCWMDSKTGDIVETFYQRRENVKKASGEPIPTNAGLDPAFSFVSAVLHSAVDCVNHPAILGDDFSILHWPAALPSRRLDPSVFAWCDQWFYQDGQLERRPKQALQE